MKKDSILSTLEKKGVEAEDIAEKVMENPNLRPELFVGISSIKSRTKFGSAKTLRIISEKKPECYTPKWIFL